MNMPPRPPQSFHVPAKLASGLLQASTSRRVTYADMLSKIQRSLGDMRAECQNLSVASRFDPSVVNALTLGQNSVVQSVAIVAQALAEAEQAELVLQGEIKRWLAGFPPSLPGVQPQAAPPPPAPPHAAGPEPAPAVHHPVQLAPNGSPVPGPVQMFESPAAAKAAAETQAVAQQAAGNPPIPAPQPPPVASPTPATQANGTATPNAS